MKKILIIEDDELIANVYRNKFTTEGYEVDVAEDGEVGLRKIHSFAPDLVILDLIIPKLTGVELMRKVRAEPAHEKLPIVVFSNTYLSNIIKDAWKAGATKCLSKASSTPKQVLEVVRGILNISAAAPAPAAAAPAAARGTPATARTAASPAAEARPAPAVPDAAQEFLHNAPPALHALRSALQILVKSPDEPTRLAQLAEMQTRCHPFTGGTAVGLTFISQLADAFEALIQELRDKPRNINPSTLRTIASAIDFLEALVKRGRSVESQRAYAPRILVVDDELLSRRAITHALERAKLTCQDVEDPLTAWQLLSENSYDLIFLDVDMPGMNGFELCAKLRTLPPHRKTPVVFVTALTDFDARTNSTMAGGNDFIGKPFPFIELALKAVIHVLRSRFDAKK